MDFAKVDGLARALVAQIADAARRARSADIAGFLQPAIAT